MSLPVIAIVGRPNVGKSRLFNRLIGKFRAIVDDQPGVTRDRHYGWSDWKGRSFIVVDTGGCIPGAEEPLNKKVWNQAFLAIQEADFLICLLDGREGITPVDEMFVKELRQVGKPVFYAVNKVDTDSLEKGVFEFSRLGIDPLFPISAEHGRGISELLEALSKKIDPSTIAPSHRRTVALPIAIIGRPNVGKSTLINYLLGQDRVIVHEEAGTTRDVIAIEVKKNGKSFVLMDTAGIKDKRKTKTRLEKLGVISGLKAIEQGQIICLLLDATQGITHQDLHLAHFIWESRKGLLFLVNKWDLMKASAKKYERDLRGQLGMLQSVPILCISAKEGRGCGRIWKSIEVLSEAMNRKLSTPQLNRWLKEALEFHPPPLYQGKNVKLYYGTQTGVNPPRFIFFANYPEKISATYKRYLENKLRVEMNIEGIPLGLTFKQRSR